MTERAQNIAPLNRREFIKSTAGVTFAVSATGLISACTEGEPVAEVPPLDPHADPLAPNIWVTVYPDDRIRIMYAGTEMGQGSMTATPLILAEHLDADWDNVDVETVAVHDTAFGNFVFANMLYTAGSTNVMAYFNKMRIAGTQARKMLVAAAASQLGVAEDGLTTLLSTVIHTPTGRRLSYGEVVSGGRFPVEIPEVDESEFKIPADYRYLGKNIMRIDVPSKVNGTAEYGMDVQVPGMLFAAIRRMPVEGEHPVEVDDSETLEVAGVTDVVTLPYGVAVLGETVEATHAGKDKLKVTWSEDSRFRKANTVEQLKEYGKAAEDLSISGTPWAETGDVAEAIAGADEVVSATYTTEPVYHAQMEPLNATASVSEDGKSAEIWVGTQTQSLTILGAAQALETTPENITLHPLTMGGGYGRRSPLRQQYIDDALFVSRAVGKPVKVLWSREDDIEVGRFRTAATQHMRGAFDADGKLIAIHHRVGAPTILETMNPMRWATAEGKDVITMLGSENTTYDIPNHMAEHVLTDRGSRVLAWRGVGTSYTKFAMESFIDELAQNRGVDPFEFRMQLCHKNPRMQNVLQNVADMADWSRPRKGRVLGIAVSGYHRSLSAGIVEISIDDEQLQVHRFWAVGDPGFVVAPSNAEAQVEGNVVMGLSAALKERITIENGHVKQSNFHDYPIIRMAELPEIETRVLSTEYPSSGVGELGLAMVGPAIANAIATLTGIRIRHLPLTPDIVAGALDSG
jgi:isoquinoline 1-oxidoreductase beta subunit